jgi:hypothetical protein
MSETRGRRRGVRATADKPQVVWRLPYKLDGSGYVLDARIHLFLIDHGSGEATQLTRGNFDVKAAAWTPDGKCVRFAGGSAALTFPRLGSRCQRGGAPSAPGRWPASVQPSSLRT